MRCTMKRKHGKIIIRPSKEGYVIPYYLWSEEDKKSYDRWLEKAAKEFIESKK